MKEISYKFIFLLLILSSFVLSCSKDNDKEIPINVETKTKTPSVNTLQEDEYNEVNVEDVVTDAKVENTVVVKELDKIEKTSVKKKRSKKVVKYIPVKVKENKKDIVSTKQAAINQTTVSVKKTDAKNTKSFSQTLDLQASTNLRSDENEKKSVDSTIWYFLRYKISSEYSARLWVDIRKNLSTDYESDLMDTKISISKKSYEITDKLKFSPSTTVIFPTSEQSKRNEELIVGFEINPSFGYKITKDLSFTYLPRFVKNFHEYETSRTAATNTEYKSIQFYVLTYAITDKWSFESTLIYANTWSYSGRRRDPGYVTVLEVGYDMSKEISFATGFETGGSHVNVENGKDQNIELFDKDIASVYGNIVLNF